MIDNDQFIVNPELLNDLKERSLRFIFDKIKESNLNYNDVGINALIVIGMMSGTALAIAADLVKKDYRAPFKILTDACYMQLMESKDENR